MRFGTTNSFPTVCRSAGLDDCCVGLANPNTITVWRSFGRALGARDIIEGCEKYALLLRSYRRKTRSSRCRHQGLPGRAHRAKPQAYSRDFSANSIAESCIARKQNVARGRGLRNPRAYTGPSLTTVALGSTTAVTTARPSCSPAGPDRLH